MTCTLPWPWLLCARYCICNDHEPSPASLQPAQAEASLMPQALLLDKSNAKAYFRRGQARRRLGQLDEALQDLAAAARLMPGDGKVSRELASLERDERTHRKAVASMFRGWAGAATSPAVPQQMTHHSSITAGLYTGLLQVWQLVCNIYRRR